MEFTLLWAALGGAAPMWLTDRHLNPVHRRFDDLLGAAIVGLICGRLAFMVAGGSLPWEHPGLIPLVRAGVHPGWAGLGALASLAWRFRNDPIVSMFGSMASPALAGLAGWEAGCLLRGTCAGTTVGTWQIPIGILVGAALAGAAATVNKLPMHLRAAGALGGAGIIRLVAEPFRSALSHSIAWWYLAALGAATFLAIRSRKTAAKSLTG